jgi:hypothetical protein
MRVGSRFKLRTVADSIPEGFNASLLRRVRLLTVAQMEWPRLLK